MVSEVEDVPPPRPQQRGQLGVVTPAVDPQLGPCTKLIFSKHRAAMLKI